MSGRPITPDEIGQAQAQELPPEVFDAFNAMIARNWAGGSATFTTSDVADEVQLRLGCEREKIFRLGYLNVEEAYRHMGWKVVFDKPAYNESYASNFTFSKKKS